MATEASLTPAELQQRTRKLYDLPSARSKRAKRGDLTGIPVLTLCQVSVPEIHCHPQKKKRKRNHLPALLRFVCVTNPEDILLNLIKIERILANLGFGKNKAENSKLSQRFSNLLDVVHDSLVSSLDRGLPGQHHVALGSFCHHDISRFSGDNAHWKDGAFDKGLDCGTNVFFNLFSVFATVEARERAEDSYDTDYGTETSRLVQNSLKLPYLWDPPP